MEAIKVINIIIWYQCQLIVKSVLFSFKWKIFRHRDSDWRLEIWRVKTPGSLSLALSSPPAQCPWLGDWADWCLHWPVPVWRLLLHTQGVTEPHNTAATLCSTHTALGRLGSALSQRRPHTHKGLVWKTLHCRADGFNVNKQLFFFKNKYEDKVRNYDYKHS